MATEEKTYCVEFGLWSDDRDGYPAEQLHEFTVTCHPDNLQQAVLETFRKEYPGICQGEHSPDWFREYFDLRFHRVYEYTEIPSESLRTTFEEAYKTGKQLSMAKAAVRLRKEIREKELKELERLEKKYRQGDS